MKLLTDQNILFNNSNIKKIIIYNSFLKRILFTIINELDNYIYRKPEFSLKKNFFDCN